MRPCRGYGGYWVLKFEGKREMTEEQKKKMIGLAIAGAAVYVAWKYAPSQAVKAMALGVGGVMVGKQLPYVREALV